MNTYIVARRIPYIRITEYTVEANSLQEAIAQARRYPDNPMIDEYQEAANTGAEWDGEVLR